MSLKALLAHASAIAAEHKIDVGVTFSRRSRADLQAPRSFAPTVYHASDPDFHPFVELSQSIPPGSAISLSALFELDLGNSLEMTVITPHGLHLHGLDYPWVWAVSIREGEYPEYRIGSAHEMLTLCRACRVSPELVFPVPAGSIHGTCVFECGERFVRTGPDNDPYAWGLVQAEGYRVAV